MFFVFSGFSHIYFLFWGGLVFLFLFPHGFSGFSVVFFPDLGPFFMRPLVFGDSGFVSVVSVFFVFPCFFAFFCLLVFLFWALLHEAPVFFVFFFCFFPCFFWFGALLMRTLVIVAFCSLKG